MNTIKFLGTFTGMYNDAHIRTNMNDVEIGGNKGDCFNVTFSTNYTLKGEFRTSLELSDDETINAINDVLSEWVRNTHNEIEIDTVYTMPDFTKDVLPLMDKTYYLNPNSAESFDQSTLSKMFEDMDFSAIDECDFLNEQDTSWERNQLRETVASSLFDDDTDLADILMDQYDDQIRETMWDRDKSDLLGDCLKMSNPLECLFTVYGNGDCLCSNWLENQDGYSYDSYFGELLDYLCINPQQMKKKMVEYGMNVQGRWPNKPNRQPVVDIDKFLIELENNCVPSNFVFLCGIDIQEYFKQDTDILTSCTIPKGTTCGIFSSFHGGGSMLELETIRDFTVFPAQWQETGSKHTKYPNVSIRKNCEISYSVNDVYGANFEWQKVTFVKK